MRGSDSGFAHGTLGSPQTTLEQELYASEVAEAESLLAREVMLDESLISELETSGVRFDRDAMLLVARDSTNQIVWLETGSRDTGLEHILHGNERTPGHAEDLWRAFGVSESDVPAFLYRVVTYGEVVSSVLKPVAGRMGFERVYEYGGLYHVVTGIGTNGYIVSAYPRRKG